MAGTYVASNTQQQVPTQDDVVLIVFGEGATQETAINAALRSAISQTYSALVSTNTSFLNNELSNDDILTQSSGNIKYYTTVANLTKANGNKCVILKAIVNVPSLTSYAKSKGASTVFSGAVFAMKMKKQELAKNNEMKALNYFLTVIKEMLPVALERKLVISEPMECSRKYLATTFVVNGDYHEPSVKDIRFKVNDAARKFADDICWGKYEINTPNYKKVFYSIDNWLNSASNSYLMNFDIQYRNSSKTTSFANLMNRILEAISMSKAEERTLKSHNSGISIVRVNYGIWGENKDVEYHFRNGNKQILQWVRQWMKSFYDYYTNFTITDNLGVASNISKDFDERVNVLGRPGDLYTVHTSNKYNIFMVGPIDYLIMKRMALIENVTASFL